MSERDKRLANSMRIFEALSGVDEELLIRCEDSGVSASAKVRPIWYYSKMMAACLCFVVMGVLLWSTRPMIKNESAADNAAMSETPAAAAMSPKEAIQDVAPAEAAVESMTADDVQLDGGTGMSAVESQAGEAFGYAENSKVVGHSAGSVGQPEADKNSEDTELITENGSCPLLVEQKLTLAEASAVALLGDYVPTVIPVGYEFESAGLSSPASDMETEHLNLCWLNGMDDILISIWVPGDYETRVMADIGKPETYNVHLYEIPYGETVPDEYRQIFQSPVFAESDFSMAVVEARMKVVADAGDTDTPRGNFTVLYDSGVLVKFNGNGDVQSIYEMFASIQK